jgi:hypothetical protein
MANAEPVPIFDTPLDEAAEADAAADAEIDAGKGIPHERVRAWLESWGQQKVAIAASTGLHRRIGRFARSTRPTSGRKHLLTMFPFCTHILPDV